MDDAELTRYLRRLARSDRLDVWPQEELTSMLAMLDDRDAERAKPSRGPRVLDLRLAIYRGRLQHELDRRSAGLGAGGARLDGH